ncbi:lipopolysaccharide biosynthesis protein [Haliangium sp.]|uniref:lipopolysaccharide biosynthesis protein n=1 Tax=Haliangium sp. TaxID=2663208 RepID=UPI003D0B1327
MSAAPPPPPSGSPPDPHGYSARDRARVARAIAVTLAGKILESSQGVALFVALHLFGKGAVGLYLIGYNLVDLLLRCVLGGFGDAAVYFASHHAEGADDEPAEARRERERELHRVLATCIGVPLGVTLALATALTLVAGPLYELLWSRQDPVLIGYLQLLAWLLPLSALVRLPVEAIKARLDMKWAVLVADGLVPATYLAAIPAAWALGLGPEGLVYAVLLGYLVGLVPAWYGFSRHFRIGATVSALVRLDLRRDVLGFALPQSVNMMFNYGLTRVDALMLAVWVEPELIGVYGALSELTRSIRAAKTSFANVFAPLVSRYKAQGNQRGLSEALDSVARSIGVVAVPILIGLLSFYPELVMGPGRPWTLPHALPWMLAMSPLAGCFYGLAGNLLLMTGHPRLLLFNSALLMALNVGLNLALIPWFGVLGAAAATMSSSLLLTGLQLVQMQRLEGVRFGPGLHRRTFLAAAAPVALIAAASQGLYQYLYAWGAGVGVALKIALVLAALALYGATLVLWPGPSPERAWLRERLAARRARREPRP